MESVSWTSAARLCLAAAFVFTIAGCGASSLQEELGEEGETVPIPELTPQEKAELESFVEPELSASEEAQVLANYNHLDPKNEVPDALLTKAVTYFDTNKLRIKNQAVLTVVDFAPHSANFRLFLINMKTGVVTKLHTSHGNGSDPDHDGIATSFGNVPGSKKSSVGFYRTAETYSGKHGLSLRLDGLSSTNSNARSRAIVIHSAAYVQEKAIKQGRSEGCIVVSPENREAVVNRLAKGSIIYAGRSSI
ncbi:MAG: murein L,D-transpeptidase catalytic domain family protein [Bdellovibrionales bacterium]|nr:murein L,D-transpeptidase catalytic domain family protein [Bdellovibrionales bacterium]